MPAGGEIDTARQDCAMEREALFTTVAQVLPAIMIVIGLEVGAMVASMQIKFNEPRLDRWMSTVWAASLGGSFLVGELSAVAALLWEPTGGVVLALKIVASWAMFWMVMWAALIPYIAVNRSKLLR